MLCNMLCSPHHDIPSCDSFSDVHCQMPFHLNSCTLLFCREDVNAKEQHDVVVHANELTYEEGVSTGGIIRYICSHAEAHNS